MTRSRIGQLSLLDWQPPTPVRSFDPVVVRAPDLAGRVARAIAASLDDAPQPRSEIAARMSDHLGQRVSTHMLNAYASQARENHTISVPRYVALVRATGDQRLLELLAEPEGYAVVHRRYLLQIELAALHERQEELRRRGDTLRKMAKFRGGIDR